MCVCVCVLGISDKKKDWNQLNVVPIKKDRQFEYIN